MKVDCLVLGDLQTNCYVLHKDSCCLVIDPADSISSIVEAIGNDTLVGVLLTHDHFDHVGALNDLLEKYPVLLYSRNNLKEGEHITLPFSFEVISTFGHTDDSYTFYFKDDKMMFTGDFLFFETVGRTDFPTGDFSVMNDSIKKISKYPIDIQVFPGHGPRTTLSHEIDYNPFFTHKNI